MAENAHLTDLTRMLLASPAFAAFLEEMSGTEKQSSTQHQQETTAPKIEEPQHDFPEDVKPQPSSPRAQNEQEDAQVSVASLPDPYINFNTTWTHDLDFGLYDAQVYAVHFMPQGPAVDHLDGEFLSGKPSGLPIGFASEKCKQNAPTIEHPLTPYHESRTQEDSTITAVGTLLQPDENDPVHALYNDVFSEPSKPTIAEPQNTLEIPSAAKGTHHFQLTIIEEAPGNDRVDSTAMVNFVRFCAMMEAASQRVESATSHL